MKLTRRTLFGAIGAAFTASRAPKVFSGIYTAPGKQPVAVWAITGSRIAPFSVTSKQIANGIIRAHRSATTWT